MNAARFNEAMRALNGVARRVFDATPISEAWPVQAIYGEVTRTGGAPIALNILTGCLDTLKQRGLVKEPAPRCFVRIAVKPEKEPAPVAITPPKAPAQTKPDDADLATRLGRLAATLRHAADQLDDIALDMDARLEQAEASTKSLRQLKALLQEA